MKAVFHSVVATPVVVAERLVLTADGSLDVREIDDLIAGYAGSFAVDNDIDVVIRRNILRL